MASTGIRGTKCATRPDGRRAPRKANRGAGSVEPHAPYTGLKPAGLDVGPVIPMAEQAIESGSPDDLVGLLSDVLHEEVKRRLDHVLALRPAPGARVPEVREYVEAMLGLQVWSHTIFARLRSDPHARTGEHED